MSEKPCYPPALGYPIGMDIPDCRVVLSLFRGLMLVPARRRTMREIGEAVAARYGLRLEHIRGPSLERKHVVPARQEAMAIAYQTGRWSDAAIGRYFGGRDHSTVNHARRRYEGRQAVAAE